MLAATTPPRAINPSGMVATPQALSPALVPPSGAPINAIRAARTELATPTACAEETRRD
ncbi:hypothetical protein [Nocardia gipuzkoensis]|uniref:hypothetical protein n=1 Tax=Nocardia gipuzkoensis TaxID=2749991 RepID=UPI0015EFB4A5|nr:hypothetical protein [Nocardia gipuzkoensis]